MIEKRMTEYDMDEDENDDDKHSKMFEIIVICVLER